MFDSSGTDVRLEEMMAHHQQDRDTAKTIKTGKVGSTRRREFWNGPAGRFGHVSLSIV